MDDVTTKNAVMSGEQTVSVKFLGFMAVTFDSRGGSMVNGISVLDGDTASAPVAPTKTGYEFSGWHTSDTDFSQATIFDFHTPVTQAVQLYANWTTTEYTVSYANLLNGTNPNTVAKYTIETETFTLANPTRVGYTGVWNNPTVLKGSTGNKTITAVWTPVAYEIVYENLLGGTNPNATTRATYTIEDVFVFGAPVREGYTGTWALDGAPISGIAKGTTGKVTVAAVWTPNENTVVFDKNGAGKGTMANQTINTAAKAYLNENTYERTGYDFSGWATTAQGAVIFEDGAEYTMGTQSSYTLYAVWTPKQYTVTYDYSIATGGNSTASFQVTFDAENHTFTTPTHTIYRFGGWFSAENGGGTKYADGNGVPTVKWNIAKNATLYAYWEGTAGVEYTKTGDTARVTRYQDGLTGKIYIQSHYLGAPVTAIGTSAFYSNEGITDVFLPDTIKTIGNTAFERCASLKSINLPEGIVSIGRDAFYLCRKLDGITIPSSLTVIGYQAFCRTGITGIVIPGSVESIGERAFEGCTDLMTVNIREGVKTIEACAFGWTNLRTVVIPESVTSMADGVFYGASSLKVYYMGNSVQWSEIAIRTDGVYNNSYVLYAPRYYYAAKQPLSSDTHWHFNSEGLPAVWTGLPTPTLGKALLGDALDSEDALNAQYDAFTNQNLTPKLVFEAEDAIRSKFITNTGISTIESSPNSSGGHSIGHYEGSDTVGHSLTFLVDSDKEIESADIAIRLAASDWSPVTNKNQDMPLAMRIIIAVNGELVDLDGLIVKQDDSYYDWTMLVIEGVLLQEGVNEILMKSINVRFPNTDVLYIYTDSDAVLTEADPADAIQSLSVTKKPAKLQYVKGQALDLTGLAVVANYYGESGYQSVMAYTTIPTDGTVLSQAGTTTVTVLFRGKTTSFEVKVVEKAVTSLSIVKLPDKLTYEENEEFEPDGLAIEAVYNDGTVTPVSLEDCDILRDGSVVTVSYLGKKVLFSLSVIPPVRNFGYYWDQLNPDSPDVGKGFNEEGTHAFWTPSAWDTFDDAPQMGTPIPVDSSGAAVAVDANGDPTEDFDGLMFTKDTMRRSSAFRIATPGLNNGYDNLLTLNGSVRNGETFRYSYMAKATGDFSFYLWQVLGVTSDFSDGTAGMRLTHQSGKFVLSMRSSNGEAMAFATDVQTTYAENEWNRFDIAATRETVNDIPKVTIEFYINGVRLMWNEINTNTFVQYVDGNYYGNVSQNSNFGPRFSVVPTGDTKVFLKQVPTVPTV